MVKLYGPLLFLTLTTSLALALPYPSNVNGRNYSERNPDEKFSGRENFADASDDLAVREPSWFTNAFHSIKNAAVKGIHLVEKVADNPFVQAAVSIIPGGGALVAAQKVAGTIGQVEKIGKEASQRVSQIQHLGGALLKNTQINKAIKIAKVVDRKVPQLTKHLGGALGNVKPIISRAKQVLASARHHTPVHHRTPVHHHRTTHRRHHRRDLEDDEDLSRRDLDADEFSEREYDDDIMAERDFYDDLD